MLLVFLFDFLISTFEEKDSSEVIGEFAFLDAPETEDDEFAPDGNINYLMESYLSSSILSALSVSLDSCFLFIGVISSNIILEQVLLFLVLAKSLDEF